MKENQKLILTVDDDPEFNILLKTKLAPFGAEILQTTNPQDFLNELKSKSPDLCLIDLNLGDSFGAGFQLIKAVRNVVGFNIPMVVLSRRTAVGDINFAIESGADDFIFKPLDDLVLSNKIPVFLHDFPAEGKQMFKQIASKYHECLVEFEIDLIKISEFSITFSSTSLIPRGVAFKLRDSIINEIFNTESFLAIVHNSWVDKQNHRFYFDAEIDHSNDKMKTAIRNYLIDK